MAGALTLVIETSNPSRERPGEVGIARGGELVASRALAPSGRHDDALMPAVAGVCEAAGVAARELELVMVSAGPGGFSAVRVAVAAAKMIALASGAGCVGVPSCASRALGSGREGVGLAALAGKRGTAWARAYRVGGGRAEALGPGAVMDEGGVAAMAERTGAGWIAADDHLPEGIRAWAWAGGVELVEPAMTAATCLAAGAAVAPVGAAELAAVYPREPEAVRKWNAARA